jgi:hypothetical protein
MFQRECIIKIVPLETDTTFCYAVISKLGRIGVYDGQMNLLDSYKLGLKPTEETTRDFGEMSAGMRTIENERLRLKNYHLFESFQERIQFNTEDQTQHG